ncbi:hypothetical protein A2U01_0021902, partial [Trifolium medium]|nr:hypothetical protein [Trifolium medium]
MNVKERKSFNGGDGVLGWIFVGFGLCGEDEDCWVMGFLELEKFVKFKGFEKDWVEGGFSRKKKKKWA